MESSVEMLDHGPGELKPTIEDHFCHKSGYTPDLFAHFFKRVQLKKITLEMQGSARELKEIEEIT